MQLSGYQDVTNVTVNRLHLKSRFRSAIHAASPALGELLRIDRDEPLPRLRPAAEVEERLWRHFLTGETVLPPAPAMPAPAPRLFPAEPQLDEQLDSDEPAIGDGQRDERHERTADADEPAELAAVPYEHGVLVLTAISTGGRTFAEGETIAPEVVATWRPRNVQAMIRSGRIQPLPSPAADGGDLPDLMA